MSSSTKVGYSMRYRNIQRLGSLAALFLLPAMSMAQPKQRLKFEDVQVGFGSLKAVAQFKSGFWTPVYIYLKAGPDGTDGPGEVTVESTDGDEVRGRYKVAFPKLNPEEVFMVQAYTKPARTEFNFTAEMNGRIVATRQEDFHSLDSGHLLFLTVGSRIPSLRPGLNPRSKTNTQEEEDESNFSQNDRCQVAGVDDVHMLPQNWFAYEPADLLFLTTGKRDTFVTALLNEREGRKEALAEWVRRGGRLVVSVGKNQDMLRDREFEAIANLLPVSVTGTVQVPNLQSIEEFAGAGTTRFQTPRSGSFEVAKLEPKPGRAVRYLRYWNDQAKETPLIVRGAYGLGSVTVVAFDLDETPFKGWKGQQPFLRRLVTETLPAYSETTLDPNQMGQFGGGQRQGADVAGQLETALEEFDEIPVISFGWVALFILIYILVVGPLDYFFLKKVVKRLELTWITFPTVVITISVAAYFTAYWLKGNDLKINKVDLVDIDLHTQQVYGNTWFTIFSPRIQHYTIGLEPVEPEWAPAPVAGKPSWPVMLSWMGRQDFGNRGQSQGLFRRAYDYAKDATGLSGVPIQVWSTKSFASAWQASFDPAKPLVSADLRLSDKARGYSGTITSRLPVPLEDVYIYWSGGAGEWYPLETLVPNSPKRVDGLIGRNGKNVDTWQASVGQMSPVAKGNPGHSPSNRTAGPILKQLMFFGRSQNNRFNLSLKELDQHWRLAHEEEAFVVGRISRTEGPAEDISAGKGSASRIWLGKLPADGGQRPPLNGTLAQETYVRFIIPVKMDSK